MSRVLVLVMLLACSSSESSEQERDRRAAASRAQRRVIEPPSGTVRKLPPYAILANEVGPYHLGQKIAVLLEKLGPSISRFEIPNLLHASVIHAEKDTVLIGGGPATASSTVSFIAVIGGSDIASTESGVHVGMAKDQLEKLGPLVDDPERARDPRMLIPVALRNGRVLLSDDRVVAIAIVTPSPPRDPAGSGDCPRPAASDGKQGACLTGAGELVEVDGDDIVVRAPETDKPITSIRVPGLAFAAPLRNVAEGRDELVAIARTDEPQQRTWSILVFKLEGGKRIVVVDPTPLYQLSSAQTRWIGADLRDVDVYLEMTSRPDGIEVGGLLTTRGQGSKIRDVVVISPVPVPRRHGKSATGEGDAGVGSSSSAAPPDGQLGADSAKL